MELTATKYKQTEVGMIPEDWGICELESVSKRVGEGIHSTPKYNDSGKYYFVNGNNLIDGKITITENTKRVTEEEFKIHKRELTTSTILISINGTIGNLAFYNNEKIVLGKSAAYINLTDDIDKQFIYQLIQTSQIRDYFENELTGSTIKNLGLGSIKRTPIPVPTLTEQKAIAQVLSDMDSLIRALEKKIAKKKDIKKGVMQKLLTPKEGWLTTSLVELAENKKSQFDDGDWIESEHIISEGIRLIQTGNMGIGSYVDKGNRKYISEASFYKLNCKEVFEGDLLICRLAEPAGRACIMPDIGEYKVITSVDVTIFRGDSNKVNREFLSQLFSTDGWFQKVMEMVGGTTHKRISRGALGKIEITIPSKGEQDKIARILSDMDKETMQLVKKLSKYQLAKKGMMQQLLTGKIRLV